MLTEAPLQIYEKMHCTLKPKWQQNWLLIMRRKKNVEYFKQTKWCLIRELPERYGSLHGAKIELQFSFRWTFCPVEHPMQMNIKKYYILYKNWLINLKNESREFESRAIDTIVIQMRKNYLLIAGRKEPSEWT